MRLHGALVVPEAKTTQLIHETQYEWCIRAKELNSQTDDTTPVHNDMEQILMSFTLTYNRDDSTVNEI